jgi:hypothetical protein
MWCSLLTIPQEYVSISLIILLILILYKLFPDDVFADSPSFARQIITDPSSDWFFVKARANSSNITTPDGHIFTIETAKNIKECTPMKKYQFHDIVAVSYYSDGRTLNSTLWLDHPFIDTPLNTSQWFFPYVKNVPLYRILYGMTIGIHSSYDVEGSDYQAKSIRNIDKTWTKTVEEMSPTNQTKVLYEKHNPGDFVKRGQRYVQLSVDLGTVTYPNQYNLLFYTNYVFIKDGRLCSLSDISERVHIPPPDFNMSISPSNAYLRPGEKKIIEFQIKSNTDAKSEVSLSTNQTDHDIQLLASPKKLSILPYGLATSRLEANVSEHAKSFDHTLLISANISIPTESRVRGSGVSSDIMKNSASANITENSHFTLTILPPLSFGERLNNFYTTTLSPISGIWTFLLGVAGVTAPLIIRAYKKQNKGKNKKFSDWFNIGK